MPYTVFVFATRNPTITSEQFKSHWEDTHIPLVKSLVGPLFPLHYKRHYFARTERKGFGGPANRDNPAFLLRGSPDNFDFDAVAELMWEDEKTFQEFYKAIHTTKTAAKLAVDENQFLHSNGWKSVVVGDTANTTR
jgi:hypothetical protein